MPLSRRLCLITSLHTRICCVGFSKLKIRCLAEDAQQSAIQVGRGSMGAHFPQMRQIQFVSWFAFYKSNFHCRTFLITCKMRVRERREQSFRSTCDSCIPHPNLFHLAKLIHLVSPSSFFLAAESRIKVRAQRAWQAFFACCSKRQYVFGTLLAKRRVHKAFL